MARTGLNPDPNSPYIRVCVRLWREDYEYIRRVSQANGEVGLNLLIRQSVHTIANQFRAKERGKIDNLAAVPAPIEITLTEEDLVDTEEAIQ
jgi:hypothetical protein